MGGQITLEGRKRRIGTVSQLLSPRSKANTTFTQLPATPRTQSTPAILATAPSPNTVQSINVRLHTLRKYRLRPKRKLGSKEESTEKQPESPHVSPIKIPLSISRTATEEDLLRTLPSPRATQRTYKLPRSSQTVRSFEEELGASERLTTIRREAPNSARRDSLTAAVELTRAPNFHRTSILSMEPLRIPAPKDQPRPSQSTPEVPARTSWGSLMERRRR